MIGACSWPIVAGKTSDTNVPKLTMGKAARRLSVDDQAHADPRADGHVSEIVEAFSRAPPHLGECGAIDVGVETRRNFGRSLQPARNIHIGPAGLRRGRRATVARRSRV